MRMCAPCIHFTCVFKMCSMKFGLTNVSLEHSWIHLRIDAHTSHRIYTFVEEENASHAHR